MKRLSLLSAAFTLLFVTIINPISAQSAADFPRLTPNPEAAVYSEQTDLNDWRSLYSLALWVSGAQGVPAVSAFEPTVERLKKEVGSLDEKEKAEAVLKFMHENLLSSYSERQTYFDRLLASGRFNCVSSAVLYVILCTAVDLEVSGVMASDHAFCTVKAGVDFYDVETTSGYGFNPGAKTEFHDAFGRTTGFAYVPPRNYRDRSPIDIMTLFSLVLSNRISDDEDAGKFSDAVGLAADRWALLGSKPGDALNMLVERMVNYGSYLAQRGREEEALKWAQQAVSTYGPDPRWDNFIDSAANNLLVRLIRRKDTGAARQKLEELRPELSAASTARLELMVSETELLDALNAVETGGSEELFVKQLEAAKTAGIVPADRIREIEVVWRLNKVKKIAETEGWAAAYSETGRIIDELGSDSQLENALRVYRSNRIAELYNSAVNTYNAGDYSSALKIAEDALAEFPADSRLKSLKSNIERTIKSLE